MHAFPSTRSHVFLTCALEPLSRIIPIHSLHVTGGTSILCFALCCYIFYTRNFGHRRSFLTLLDPLTLPASTSLKRHRSKYIRPTTSHLELRHSSVYSPRLNWSLSRGTYQLCCWCCASPLERFWCYCPVTVLVIVSIKARTSWLLRRLLLGIGISSTPILFC